MEKNNNDLMQESCIQFIMFYKFNQIRRNNSRQSSQQFSRVPPKTGLFRYTRQIPQKSQQQNNITKL